ncbi:S-layer homology domain-containing protein [Aneurinibacillus sp. BA2021]|nr:S-layer homology domain-containing protein [Aneurinibacillus sp. BA2021]
MESNLKKKLNKVLSTAVVLSAVLAPSAALADAPFKDLNKAAAWAQGGILEAQSRGLLKGDEKGNFRPTALVTRQEVASILVNILKLEEPNVQTSSYTDVPANAWGLKAIEAVKNAGIMRGDGNGKFRPNAPVTREELASVLVGAINADTTGRGTNLNVADAAQISSWAKPAVEVAMEKGLLRGDGKNFNPKQKAPRQEVAIMAVNLANALGQVTKPIPVPTTPDTLEAKVEGVTDSTITLNGKSYNLASDVKGLFNAKNSEALKGATVKAEMKDGAVAKITYLELNAAGKAAKSGEKEFSGNVVLDGGVVNGNVKVKGDYVSLKNVTVKGDLEIAKEVENDFYSYNVKVDGKTFINGGDSNTVVFEAGTLGAVEINKKGVRVEATGKTTIGNVTVSSNAVIVAESGVTIPKVTVQSGVSSIEVKATVTTLDITDKNTKVTVADGASINNLVLPSGVRAEDVVNNYSQVKNRISKVNNSSSSTGGGGGGGGSSVINRTYNTDNETVKNLGTVDNVTIGGNKVTLENGTIKGNITITSDNVILKNITIKGNVTMKADKKVTLDGSTVQGTTILN